MGIPIGDYIRTKNGIIAKAITPEYEYKDDYKQDFDNEILNDWYNDEIIVKNSPNIINLIEIGDWAIMNCYGLIVKKVITQDDIWELKTGNYKLLKILTKERFESESYEV